MPMNGKTIFGRTTLLIVLVVVFGPTTANAKSFKKLIQDGYSISQMSANAAGKLGWYLTGSDARYFCRIGRVSIVTVGPTGLASLSGNGRLITMDRQTYVSRAGERALRNLPDYNDLKRGSMDARFVGRCSKS